VSSSSRRVSVVIPKGARDPAKLAKAASRILRFLRVTSSAGALLVVTGDTVRGQAPSYAPDAQVLLREVERANRALNSLQADVSVVRIVGAKKEKLTGTARLMRPNLAMVVLKGRLGQTIASDGTRVWVYNALTDQFLKRTAESAGTDLAKTFGPLIPLAYFFDPAVITRDSPPGARVRKERPVTRNGIRYDVVAFAAPNIEIRLFVGPDRLVRRAISTATRGEQSASIDTEITNLKVNTPIPNTAFKYQPPRTARELPGPIRVEVTPPSGKPKGK